MRADEGKHVRFGTRVNSRVPVAIRWVEDGRPMTMEARTRLISASGCFAVASQPVLVGQRIRLINLISGKECDAQVVRHGQQTASTWELGIRLDSQLDDFWGLEF
jgi:PilZ domain